MDASSFSARSKLIPVRLDARLIARLDAEAERESEATSEPCRRSTLVRRLLREALEARAAQGGGR